MTATSDLARRAVGTSDRPALRRVVALPPDEFAADYWSHRPLLSAAADLPRGFADLFGPDAVDELVSERGLRTPFLRMARDGTVIEPRRFTRPGGVGAEIGDQVSDEDLLRLFQDGATMVLQGLHRVWAPLIAFSAQLTDDLGHPTQVNAYVTPPSSRGFSPHYDVHDVVVLQISGEKHWSIHAPVHGHPLRTQPWTDRRSEVAAAAEGEPVIDAVLRPGDALYLPRGYLHSARALGETSIHLTVGIHAVTRMTLVDAVVRLAQDDPALRASLPLGLDLTDPEELAGHLAVTVEALARRASEATAAQVAPAVVRAQRGGGRAAPVAPLATAALAARLDTSDVLARRLHLAATLRDTEGGDLEVVLPDRTVTFPAAEAGAVRRALAGAPVRVGDLPGLDAADAVALGQRLLTEALVVGV